MTNARPFVFGIDRAPGCAGALAFATWLRATLGPDDVEAVHVVAAHDDPAVRDARRAAARAALAARYGADALAHTFSRVQVREAAGVVAGLGGVADFARALVIGRRARSGERALVHLGSVARRLLRGLPLPTVVVPPELDATALGGPIVLATDLEEHSVSAARFAERLADACRCELVVIHAAEVPFTEYTYETDADWLARCEKFRDDAAAALDRWAEEHRLGRARRIGLCGSPVELLLEFAAHARPSLLVLGSRRLSATERVFTSSMASTVAAYAGCPVAVIPPAT
jgi:nucleotide-binding universal stress UspA family protein